MISILALFIASCAASSTPRPAAILRGFDGAPKGIVIDGLVSQKVLRAARGYIEAFGEWKHDVEVDRLIKQRKELPTEDVAPGNGVRFRQNLDRTWVESSSIGRGALEAVEQVSESSEWELESAEAHHTRRGDSTFVHSPCGTGWYVLLAVTALDDINAYGEVVLFEHVTVGKQEEEDGGGKTILDSFGGVRLKPGRIVAFPCGSTFVRRSPPSVATGAGQLVFGLHFVPKHTRSEIREEMALSPNGTILPKYLGNSELPRELITDDQRVASWNLSWAIDPNLTPEQKRSIALSHRSRVYASTLGGMVHVFDQLFPDPTPLQLLRDYIAKTATYAFDDSVDSESDNVQWIVGLDEKEFAKTIVFSVLNTVVNAVTPWQGFAPYDVSVNIIRPWDHTRVHTDCRETELEYTALLYLSEDVGVHDGAETVFFDDASPGLTRAEMYEKWKQNEKEDGSGYGAGPPDAEVVAVVRPVFGRLAVFNGNVPHSARPPAASYQSIRFTLAVKHSSSAAAAATKTLLQSLHGVQEEVDRDVTRKDQAWTQRAGQLQKFVSHISKLNKEATAKDASTMYRLAQAVPSAVLPTSFAGPQFPASPDQQTPPTGRSNDSPPLLPPAVALAPRTVPSLDKARKRIESWVGELEAAAQTELYHNLGVTPEALARIQATQAAKKRLEESIEEEDL